MQPDANAALKEQLDEEGKLWKQIRSGYVRFWWKARRGRRFRR